MADIDDVRARLAARTYTRADVKALLTEIARLRKVADAAQDVIYDTQLDGIGVDSDRRLGALSAALDALGADQ